RLLRLARFVVFPQIEARSKKGDPRDYNRQQPQSSPQKLRTPHVQSRPNQPKKPDGMRDESESEQRQDPEPLRTSCSPHNGQTKERQPERKVVIEEAHVKRVAVRQHGQARRKRPRRLPGRRAHECKCPPEENQDTRGNDNLLCRGES